jgi:hypothetical protein
MWNLLCSFSLSGWQITVSEVLENPKRLFLLELLGGYMVISYCWQFLHSACCLHVLHFLCFWTLCLSCFGFVLARFSKLQKKRVTILAKFHLSKNTLVQSWMWLRLAESYIRLREEVKLAMGPYCKQYKSIACFFFHWVPNCLTKSCQVITRDEISVLLCMLWACNGHYDAYHCTLSVYYMLKAHIRGLKNCVWGNIHLFFKKMDWVKGRQDKRRSKQCFCIVCNKDPLLIL